MPTCPTVAAYSDVHIVESYDPGQVPGKDKPKLTAFYTVTKDDDFWFGETTKGKRECTFDEIEACLEYVPDEEVYPEVPSNMTITIAPETCNEDNAYVKRPGFNSYDSLKGTGWIPNAMLDETLMMEKLAKSPHPNMIKYLGCHLKGNRITAIFVEQLERTLMQWSEEPDFAEADKKGIFDKVQSAVDHLHSLGLAHNDLNPYNIMSRNGEPVLIDFGSCQTFGGRITSAGSPGWCEGTFFTSEKSHDEYGMNKIREWLGID